MRSILGCILLIASLLNGSNAGSTIQFAHIPNTVFLPPTASDLHAYDVESLIRQLMGFTTDVPSSWQGEGDALNRPEAVMVLNIRQLDPAIIDELKYTHQVDTDKHVNTYVLQGNMQEIDAALHYLSTDIETIFNPEQSAAVRLTKTSIKTFGTLNIDWSAPVKLSAKAPVLREELANIARLNNFLSTTDMRKGSPSMFAADVYGASEIPATEDLLQLKQTLTQISHTFVQAYKGNCLMVVVFEDNLPLDDTQHIRRKRQADIPKAKAGADIPITYDFASEDRPAMLAIILFVSLALIILVFFVLLMFWFMDPGKDTIIYRMTMTRAKKD